VSLADCERGGLMSRQRWKIFIGSGISYPTGRDASHANYIHRSHVSRVSRIFRETKKKKTTPRTNASLQGKVFDFAGRDLRSNRTPSGSVAPRSHACLGGGLNTAIINGTAESESLESPSYFLGSLLFTFLNGNPESSRREGGGGKNYAPRELPGTLASRN